MNKLLVSVILGTSMIFQSCDLLNSNAEGDANSDLLEKITTSLENEPENFQACLDIVESYSDSLENPQVDSTVAKGVMEKITDLEISFALEASQIRFSSPLSKCLRVIGADVRFNEHEESMTERNLLRFFDSNTYPLVEILVKCNVIERLPANQYANRFDYEVPVKDFQGNSISNFGKFRLKDEGIADYVGPNTYYEMNKEEEREILLIYKLWDEAEAAEKSEVISNRTKRIFEALIALQQIDNLKIDLQPYPSESGSSGGGGGGEVIHTGPRGGRYVIRNGNKRYVK